MAKVYSVLAGGYVDTPEGVKSSKSSKEMQKMFNQLGAQLIESEERCQVAEDEASKLRAQITAIEARLTAANEKLAAANEKLTVAESRILVAEKKTQEKRVQIADITKKMDTMRAEIVRPVVQPPPAKPLAYDVRVTGRDEKGRLANLELLPKVSSRLT